MKRMTFLVVFASIGLACILPLFCKGDIEEPVDEYGIEMPEWLRGVRVPDLRIDMRFVEYGYEIDWFIDGEHFEKMSGSRDFSKNYSIDSLIAEVVSKINETIDNFTKEK